MRIKLDDREYWLKVINIGLRHIALYRKEQQSNYDSLPWWKKIIERDPSQAFIPAYRFTETTLEIITELLNTEYISEILLDYDDMKHLLWAESIYKKWGWR